MLRYWIVSGLRLRYAVIEFTSWSGRVEVVKIMRKASEIPCLSWVESDLSFSAFGACDQLSASMAFVFVYVNQDAHEFLLVDVIGIETSSGIE